MPTNFNAQRTVVTPCKYITHFIYTWIKQPAQLNVTLVNQIYTLGS